MSISSDFLYFMVFRHTCASALRV